MSILIGGKFCQPFSPIHSVLKTGPGAKDGEMQQVKKNVPKRCFLTTQVKIDNDDECYKCILSFAPNVLSSLSQVCTQQNEKLSLISNGN